ncbi:hypothetical protein AVM11_09225 [Sphingomonas melonis TY]|uniref:Uncharacterized protein n=1 Tax=Sphingomonas melonis TY TaxID=621456 RepID=A0A175Y0J2_9SPHN|nr:MULTISPECIES: membrane protein [Sphingomonas]AOW25412.1 DUF4126 domain-containing protein [Sphingomonas melonis TY]KZB94227.1 hypothetical protein AVM11_09225 [Sphingomonas melonis TY]MCM2299186.1 DUF4126 domain-containing protein [Sphingomonas sp.]
MLRSFLIGLVAGQRGMTPLAVVAGAARRGTLSAEMPGTRLLAHPVGAGGAVAMAAAEMTGDKMATAPDRTIPPGLIARAMSAGFAGAALAERRRVTSALVAATTAVAAAYAGLALRRYGMRRWGQTATGFVEDAAVLAGGIAIARLPAR